MFILTIILVVFTVLLSPIHAETLREMLTRSFHASNELDTQRFVVQETNEAHARAYALIRPSATATVDFGIISGRNDVAGVSSTKTGHSAVAEIAGSQPLYTFGRFGAAIDSAEITSRSALLTYDSKVQSFLADAALAYFDLIGARQKLRVTKNNVDVLRSQLRATQDRFEVGELTRTDVALAGSRLARVAEAELAAAESDLRAAEAAYLRISSEMPQEASFPGQFNFLPATLEEAYQLAEENAFSIRLATIAVDLAEKKIEGAKAEFQPQVKLKSSVKTSDSEYPNDTQSTSLGVIAELSVPLYNAGLLRSKVRETESVYAQKRAMVLNERTLVREKVTKSWSELTSKLSTMSSGKIAVQAAKLALQGTREEYNVGERTLVDVLDAEQDFLEASVQLIQSEVGWYKSQVTLAETIGIFTPQMLGLKLDQSALVVPPVTEPAWYEDVKIPTLW